MNSNERLMINRLNGKNVGAWIKRRSIKMRSVYEQHPNLCIQCFKPIRFRMRLKHKFCSKACVSKFYTFDAVGVTEEIVNGISMWTRRCKSCDKKLYHTRHTNAVRLERTGGVCRSCSKKNPSLDTTKKRVNSFLATREKIRQQKGFYEKI